MEHSKSIEALIDQYGENWSDKILEDQKEELIRRQGIAFKTEYANIIKSR
jgi:hypothetical protein